jgi:hypothetical protein
MSWSSDTGGVVRQSSAAPARGVVGIMKQNMIKLYTGNFLHPKQDHQIKNHKYVIAIFY